MPRRGVNIYKRKDGRWEGRIKKEDESGVSRKYISVYGKTYTEVKNKMDKMKDSQRKQTGQCRYLFGDVVKIWLNEKQTYWKPSTYATYYQIASKYIIPGLGHLRTEQIHEQQLEQFLTDIRREHKGKSLSVRYLHNICAVVLKAIAYCKKKYHYVIEVPENPVEVDKKPQRLLPDEKDMAALEKYLFQHAHENTCMGILVAFYTGIRIGEACALTWGDINLEEGLIYIRKNIQRVKAGDGQKNSTQVLFQTPKTSTSLRMIPIPPVLLPILKEHQGAEDEYIIQGRKKPWAEPRTLQYRFAAILKKCGIGYFNFHMLRHAFATRCIAKGFDVKSLSEILGHSSIQITLSLYVHSDLQRKKQLMNKINFYFYQNYSQAM